MIYTLQYERPPKSTSGIEIYVSKRVPDIYSLINERLLRFLIMIPRQTQLMRISCRMRVNVSVCLETDGNKGERV